MVNYCCVSGCGRNSRSSKQLNYFSLPKERSRQIEWFQAAGREDLLEKRQEKLGYRFCSRHFEPSSVKNKHLRADAVPTLHLPGSKADNDSDHDEVWKHDDIACNNCKEPIMGFRYKCLTCPDYDLCSICENVETHPEHYMLRISKPVQNDTTDKLDKLIKKWNQIFSPEDQSGEISSDDEPITKYVRNYDSGVDLSEDLKEKIRKEVTRALSTTKKKKVKPVKKKQVDVNKFAKRQKPKPIESQDRRESFPEMVFVSGPVADVKTENTEMQAMMSLQDMSMQHEQPLVHVKISDDFNDLLIEIPGQQQTIYKYN